MKNLKIGIRLGIGFVCMIVLIGFLTVFAYVQIGKINEQLDHIANGNFPKAQAASAAMESIQNVSRSVIMIVAIEDPVFRGKVQKYIEEQRARYRESIKKLDDLEKNEKGKVLIENMKQAIKELAGFNNKAIELALSGKQADADKVLSTEVEPKISPLLKAAGEISDYQAGRVDFRYKESQALVKSAYTWLIIACVFAILMAIACAVLITRSITVPLDRMRSMFQDIAQGEGDLTKRLDVSSKDELGETCRWFNVFVDKLHGIIGQVAGNAVQVASAANQLMATAEQIATGAEEVAAQASTVATAGEEMSATSGDIAQNCQMAAEGGNQASSAASSGAEVVDRTVQVMQRIASRVQSTAKNVESLGARSDQIGAIIGTIQDIADQTNLLALNAAIEAARAGEQGRGFAVVADEVRALAERTTKATREIGEMIKAIQTETKSAVAAMEEGVREVESGTAEAAKSGQALQDILEQINAVTMQVNQVATAAEEQTATTGEISNNIHQITEVVQETAKGAQESSSAAGELAKLAEDLQRLVGQFKL